MIETICQTLFLLAQNESEKTLTIVGLALFGAFIFYLILDSTIKGKLVPKKGPLRNFLIFIFIVIIVAIIMLCIFIK